MRIAFMGTPDFASFALEALIAAGHEIAAVYSQPPRPAGRGHKLQKSAVQLCAEKHGLLVRTPKSLRVEEAQAEFAALGLDLAVVAAYGLILPKEILDAPKYGCFNIHGSILPRWRGAAPIQRAILAGDDETGITIMQMDEGLDTGDMLIKETVQIDGKTTGESLHDELADIGARLIVKSLEELEAGNLRPEKQDDNKANYAKKLSKKESQIDWGETAAEIDRKIRAFTPWPSTWFDSVSKNGKKERVKVKKATIVHLSGKIGQIIDDELIIGCGNDTAIRLDFVQRAGRKEVSGADYLRGVDIKTGDILPLLKEHA